MKHRREPTGGYFEDLSPVDVTGIYATALSRLQKSSRTYIAHIDSGVAPHAALGYSGNIAPPNLLIHLGKNTYDPDVNLKPISSLRRSSGLVAGLTEYPDHGVKTLSVILGTQVGSGDGGIAGVAPGAKVVPFRAANGPLFRAARGPIFNLHGAHPTRPLGQAIKAAVDTVAPIRVMSISMGNPRFLGFFEVLTKAGKGRSGLDEGTQRAIDAAYDNGIIIVCAAGQIIDSVVHPAVNKRTIAVGGFDDRSDQNNLFGQPLGLFHYPQDGYRLWEWVDVWAQAERINRAAYDRYGPGAQEIYARDGGDDPSGTSYAAPQVAAAAALWVELHYDALKAKFGSISTWKVVESFRKALHESSLTEAMMIDHGSRVYRRTLDIPTLLLRDPPEVFEKDKKRSAVGETVW